MAKIGITVHRAHLDQASEQEMDILRWLDHHRSDGLKGAAEEFAMTSDDIAKTLSSLEHRGVLTISWPNWFKQRLN